MYSMAAAPLLASPSASSFSATVSKMREQPVMLLGLYMAIEKSKNDILDQDSVTEYFHAQPEIKSKHALSQPTTERLLSLVSTMCAKPRFRPYAWVTKSPLIWEVFTHFCSDLINLHYAIIDSGSNSSHALFDFARCRIDAIELAVNLRKSYITTRNGMVKWSEFDDCAFVRQSKDGTFNLIVQHPFEDIQYGDHDCAEELFETKKSFETTDNSYEPFTYECRNFEIPTECANLLNRHFTYAVGINTELPAPVVDIPDDCDSSDMYETESITSDSYFSAEETTDTLSTDGVESVIAQGCTNTINYAPYVPESHNTEQLHNGWSDRDAENGVEYDDTPINNYAHLGARPKDPIPITKTKKRNRRNKRSRAKYAEVDFCVRCEHEMDQCICELVEPIEHKIHIVKRNEPYVDSTIDDLLDTRVFLPSANMYIPHPSNIYDDAFVDPFGGYNDYDDGYS